MKLRRGAEYYTSGYDVECRKITDRNTHCGFVDGEWMETMDRSLSTERINKGFNLSKLQKQLDEMKMNDKKLTVKQARDMGVVFVDGDLIDRKNSKGDPLRNSETEWINNGGVLHDNEVKSLIYRNHTTDEMPCDGDMVIEVYTKETYMVAYKAELLNWSDDSQDDFVSKWRPHLQSLIERANKINDSQDMQSVDSSNKESAYDEGVRNCVKDISRIIGLNFPANVGYGNLADEVDLFIDKIDGRASQDFRSKLIKALGYIDHHLSGDELITRVAEMREEYLQLKKQIVITHSVGELSVTKGFDSVEDAREYEKLELSGNTEELKNGDVVCTPLGDGVIVGASIRKSDFWWVELDDEECAHDIHKSDLSKPLTPKQKQAQIDDKNGESYYKIVCKVENDNDVCGLNNPWCELKDKWQKIYIDIAKQIDFNGKLSA